MPHRHTTENTVIQKQIIGSLIFFYLQNYSQAGRTTLCTEQHCFWDPFMGHIRHCAQFTCRYVP